MTNLKTSLTLALLVFAPVAQAQGEDFDCLVERERISLEDDTSSMEPSKVCEISLYCGEKARFYDNVADIVSPYEVDLRLKNREKAYQARQNSYMLKMIADRGLKKQNPKAEFCPYSE